MSVSMNREAIRPAMQVGSTRVGTGVTALLAVFAAVTMAIGLWQTFGPASFYESFPGFGMHWVDVDGPYNEHLMRDTGEGNLGIGAVLVFAVVIRHRLVARTAALALLFAHLPHTAYHVIHIDELATTTDQVLNTTVVLAAAVGAIVLALATFRPGGSSQQDEPTTN